MKLILASVAALLMCGCAPKVEPMPAMNLAPFEPVCMSTDPGQVWEYNFQLHPNDTGNQLVYAFSRDVPVVYQRECHGYDNFVSISSGITHATDSDQLTDPGDSYTCGYNSQCVVENHGTISQINK